MDVPAHVRSATIEVSATVSKLTSRESGRTGKVPAHPSVRAVVIWFQSVESITGRLFCRVIVAIDVLAESPPHVVFLSINIVIY